MGDEFYLLWSVEHNLWWRGDAGYTPSLAEAARYSHAEALRIATAAIAGDADALGMLPDLPVRLADVSTMQTRYHQHYPARRAERWE